MLYRVKMVKEINVALLTSQLNSHEFISVNSARYFKKINNYRLQ